MSDVTVSVGYIPLVDAAPLIIAEEMGFARNEGVHLDLVRAPSWSSVRDMLAFGRVDAAHLLSPIPVAMALGLGGVATPISAVAVLSVNGNAIGVSNALAGRLRDAGYGFDFADAGAAGAALLSAIDGPLRFGVPFPFSMHHEILRYWFQAVGWPADRAEIHTVPPPLMADALAAGEVDAFCVGEPWGSIAVERGIASLLLPGSAIWRFAPEKVLAVRTDWAETEPSLLGRIMRATWNAGRWLSVPANAVVAAEILARPDYLRMAPEIIDRSLSGHLTITPQGDQRATPGFLEFHDGAASFPWRSQAAWIAEQVARRAGLDPTQASRKARHVFRSDLYRHHLAPTGAPMPGASSKLEGSIRQPTPVASESGRLFLQPDGFFDGRIFDPGPA
ncbi:ABC transporter substrate-binding protein [Gymnodinialimonas sp. 2305UL16-5]|uniref:ABC transporter substrate-binding protein n=1 Tax=Gymnodinialimonas mytili TaxID=3126503 RepID=UPI003098694E